MNAIQVKAPDGRHIFIETGEEITIAKPAAGGGGRTSGTAADVLDRFRDVGETIADVCKSMHTEVARALDKVRPDELTLEFGVKLAGEAGIPLLTKSSVEGTFQVTATWKWEK